MKFEIKHRWGGATLFSMETDTLKLAVEAAVNSRANLSGANLSRADLSGADGVIPARVTPLLMLLDQPGKIRAYKLINEKGEGPMSGGIVYRKGKTYTVKDANRDPWVGCGAGINLATLDWCLKEWKPGYRILIAEFTAEDIAAIPTATDGKFRVVRCKIVGEKKLDELVPAAVVAGTGTGGRT